MKKTTLFLVAAVFIFGLFTTNINNTAAYSEWEGDRGQGCQPGFLYSPVTGMPCTSQPIEEGCQSGFLYNPKTGEPCNEGPTLPPTPVCTVTEFSLGARGTGVVSLQNTLTQKGYYFGKIDGIYGPITAKAARAYGDYYDTDCPDAPVISILTSSPLPSAKVGNKYELVLKASGGLKDPVWNDYVWSVSSGSLPSGLQLAEGLAIMGVPTKAGIYNFSLTASTGSHYATKKFTLTVNSGITDISSITVLSPNGGETYKAGGSLTVKWKAVNFSSDSTVYLELRPRSFNLGPVTKIAVVPAATGYFSWRIPSTVAAGQYVIEAYKADRNGNIDSDESVKDVSDQTFSIASSTTGASVTVLSPNGGETWQIGKTYNIKWTTGRIYCIQAPCVQPSIPETVSIDLVGYDSDMAWDLSIAKSVPNTGSYSWTVPSLTVGAKYKLAIRKAGGGELYDQSDDYFKVTSGTTRIPVIQVLSPNGGETWQKGTSQTIKWQNTIDISTHEIKLVSYFPPPAPCTTRYCAMPSYVVSEYTIANTQGSYYKWPVGKTWETNNVPDGQYMIRVCQTGTSVCDTSNSYFKIISGTSTQPSTLTAERHASSPSGFISSGAQKELLRVTIKATGNDAVISKLDFDLVGPAVQYVSNIKAYIDGDEAGKLSNFVNTSSWYYKGAIYLNNDWSVQEDDFVTISIRGDVSSSAAASQSWMWINLTDVLGSGENGGVAQPIGLPVYGNQVNIMTGPIITPPHEDPVLIEDADVLGTQSFTFTQKLELGMEGNEAKELQKYLAAKGYYSGDIDGKFGFQTHRALVSFQITNGLKVDGVVGAEVRAILNK